MEEEIESEVRKVISIVFSSHKITAVKRIRTVCYAVIFIRQMDYKNII